MSKTWDWSRSFQRDIQKHSAARENQCPTCGAPKGERCLDILPSWEVHRSRLDLPHEPHPASEDWS